ncbi:MAG: amino acid permease [Bacteroidia bacterium]|nr:amino acid permease [Bacteroidia bacterium]NND51027.1 amino acid permease [Flavobacteriaceae bacterium]
MSQTKKIGLLASTSFVIGNMIGAGIFVLPALLAKYGTISLLGWVFSAVGALILARIFSNFSKIIVNKSGGPYTYSKAGFGDFIGFLVAWGYWISIWVANAALAFTIVGALSFFFPILDGNPVYSVLTGLAFIWLFTWINTLGIKESGNVQIITTILKLVPLVFVIVVGLFFFSFDNFPAFNLTAESDFATFPIVAALTLYAFLGVESASIPAAEVKNPEKTVARATMLGTSITALVYILSTIILFGVLPIDVLSNSPSPFAEAARLMGGEYGGYLVAGGIAIAAIGCLNGWLLFTGQIPMAASQDELFPKIFKKKNKKGAPAMGLIIGSVLTSIVMLMNFSEGLVKQFEFVAEIVVFTNLIPYLFVAASYIIVLINRRLHDNNWVKTLVLGTLGIAFSIWAIYGSGSETVFYGFILLAIGIPFYAIMLWNKREK